MTQKTKCAQCGRQKLTAPCLDCAKRLCIRCVKKERCTDCYIKNAPPETFVREYYAEKMVSLT